MTAPGYKEFLSSKVKLAKQIGFSIGWDDINPLLSPHQKAMVVWMVMMGRCACFASFGLGKTFVQLEVIRIIKQLAGGMAGIIIPLNVRQEFAHDAYTLATGDNPKITDAQRAELRRWQAAGPGRIPEVKFVRTNAETEGNEAPIYLINYESVRDGKFDPRKLTATSLDEASILRGFGGTKTFREFMALFAGDRKTMNMRVRTEAVEFRFVATATPSPNDYIELLAYSAFLGVMDVGQAKTRFFKRDSTKADQLTLHAHKEREFWMWVASWALFVEKPSDLGFSDEGYELPELDIRWHEIPEDHSSAGTDFRGQGLLLKEQAIGIVEAAREKRDSLDKRIAKMMEIRAEDLDAHRILWHDLEAERVAIERAIPDVISVYGAQDDDTKAENIIAFSEGRARELAGKPVMLGSGCNFQRHCHWAIFLGIGHKFNDFIQAIHRLQRFLQEHKVRIDLIYTEAERCVRMSLEEKWRKDKEQRQKMTDIIREYGLSTAAMAEHLQRAMGVQRIEVSGQNYRIANNDCVEETKRMASNSVGLIHSSFPFSTQYEYSPNYADFGHTDNNDHFFQQLDYLTPELYRVLAPGRIAAIHVKDRIVPGGMTGLGYQTVYPFHSECIKHFQKHGFGYMGMITIATDVVRENNQTYRLGHTEMCKDGSKMSVGLPEYLLLFRKTPSDTSNAYADEPVQHVKPLCRTVDGAEVPWERGLPTIPGTGYSCARWQIDAHGFWRTAGNRRLTPDELETLDHDLLFKWFRDYNLQNLYDYEHHVKVGETLEALGRLPTKFMLLQPPSLMDTIWTDVARMRTLNMYQAVKGKEQHLCPLPLDIVDRTIERFSNKGDVVYDPFGGIMTVPERAIRLGRFGAAAELSTTYFMDGAHHCKAAENDMAMPDMFAALEAAA